MVGSATPCVPQSSPDSVHAAVCRRPSKQRARSGAPCHVPALLCGLILLALSTVPSFAAVPLVLHFQGHIASGGVSVDGPGEFKFALIDAGGSVSWSNSPFPAGGNQPLQAVVLTIQKGFYSVRLGDSVISNMAPLTLSAFQADNLKLRIWFNDGQQGFEQLTPDQPLAASAFAVSAARAETAGTVESIPEGLLEQRHLPSDFVGQVATLNAQIAAVNEQLAFLNGIAQSALTLSNSVIGSFSTMAAVSINPVDPLLTSGGFRRFTTLEASGWESGTTSGAPLPRYRHTGVWTGNEFVIFGGNLLGEVPGDGGRMYRPATDEWVPMSPVDALSDRRSHSAVWTGTEVIFWGGFCFPGFQGNGSRFNPVNQTWKATSVDGIPVGRESHQAVWTGDRMAVWGGRTENGVRNDGGLYDPVADNWSPLPSGNAPTARFEFTMVWTGDRILVWGGTVASGRPVNTGAQLIFQNGVPVSWQPITLTGAPAARALHAAVWTGEKMLVWGGLGAGSLLSDGAAYDPVSDSWEPLETQGAPASRDLHSAVWTGSEMLIYGGNTVSGSTQAAHAYEPLLRQWRTLPSSGSPIARGEATAVWTGQEMLVFGGRQDGSIIGAIQRIDPSPPIHLFRIP